MLRRRSVLVWAGSEGDWLRRVSPSRRRARRPVRFASCRSNTIPTGELHGTAADRRTPADLGTIRAASPQSQTGSKPSPRVRRWLREPLLHFLLAGALIFAIYQLLNPAANRTDRANQIALTKDDLRQLAMHWLAQGRPLPTAD